MGRLLSRQQSIAETLKARDVFSKAQILTEDEGDLFSLVQQAAAKTDGLTLLVMLHSGKNGARSTMGPSFEPQLTISIFKPLAVSDVHLLDVVELVLACLHNFHPQGANGPLEHDATPFDTGPSMPGFVIKNVHFHCAYKAQTKADLASNLINQPKGP